MPKNKINKKSIEIKGSVMSANIIMGNNNIIGNASKEAEKVFQLRPTVSDFLGREQEIKELLYESNFENERVLVINGMGGVGKTEIALEIAHRLSQEYLDGQIYINLRGLDEKPVTPDEIMRHVIFSLFPTQNLDTNSVVDISAKYYSVLQERKIILFFDNAASADHVQDVLPPKSCVAIITTRNQFVLTGITTYKTILPFSNESAASSDLLLKIFPDIGEFALKIAELCGHLPLALRIAGSFLRTYPEIKPEKYFYALSEFGTEVLVSQDHPRSMNVRATIALSLLQLSITERFLFIWLAIFQSSFTLDAALAVWGNIDHDAAKFTMFIWRILFRFKKIYLAKFSTPSTLIKFRKLSLLQYDNDTERYFFHNLVSEFALSFADGDFQLGRLFHTIYYAKLAVEINKGVTTNGPEFYNSLRLWDLEWRNIEAGQHWAMKNLNSFFYYTAIESLVNYASPISAITLKLKPERAIKWFDDTIFAVGKYSWMGGHEYALPHLYLFALFSSARANAFDKIQRYTDLLIEKLKEEDISTAWVYSSLGFLYKNMGYPEKSTRYLEKSKAILTKAKVQSSGDAGLLNLINFQVAYLSGDLSTMEEQLNQFAPLGSTSDNANLSLLIAVENAENSDFEKSLKYLEDARALFKVLDLNEFYINLHVSEALIYLNMDDYDRALDACNEAEKRLANENNPYSLGNTYGLKGLSYYYMNDYENARKYFTTALELLENFKIPAAEKQIKTYKEMLDVIEETG